MSHKKITSTDSPIGEREYKSMRSVGSGKTFREISDHTVRRIKRIVYPFLELPGRHNLQWTSTEILDIVVQAGKRNTCLEDTVNSLNLLKPKIVRGIVVPSYPNAKTVFRRTKKVDTREWIRKYEEANRKLLESAVKARVFRGWVDLAIDIHDIPFYGKRNTRGIVGTKRKLGTNYAFRYMTVCVTAQKDKYTLSATPMTQLSSTPKTLEEMLVKALKYIDGHIGVTYVDRGFFSVPCIKTFEKLSDASH
jgi:hypothetical protein